MPDGLARALPKRRGSWVEPLPGYTASWDSGTNDISVPSNLPDDAVLLLLLAFDSLAYAFVPGATQDTSIVTMKLASSLNGTNGVQSDIALARKLPGQAWPATINHNNNATSLDSMICVPFRPSAGFIGVAQQQYRQPTPGTVSSFTHTPPVNVGPRPGGLYVVSVGMDSGGAGPSMTAGNGWTVVSSGGLCVGAYWRIGPSEVATPPPITVSSSRSDTWAICGAYIV